jgi:hypothetical protein
MSGWTPDEANLMQLVTLFQQGTNPDPAVQRNLIEVIIITILCTKKVCLNVLTCLSIDQQFESFNNVPDYNKYLMYIFARLEGDAMTQQQAGFRLKNNVLQNNWLSLDESTRQYIKVFFRLFVCLFVVV